MAVTVSLFNHTAARFADGTFSATDTYKVLLATSATFNAAATTLAGLTYTQHANQNGYTTGGQTLTGVTVSTVNTKDARFDADDVIWTATSAGPIEAAYAILYTTDAGSPPVCFIDFGGTESAGATTDFKIIWSATGLFNWTVN